MDKIKLGQLVKDVITGYKGVTTGKVTYLTGCDQFLVSPTVENERKKPKGEWFDENRLKFLGWALGIHDHNLRFGDNAWRPILGGGPAEGHPDSAPRR